MQMMRLSPLQSSLDFLSAQYDSLLKSFKEQESKIKELSSENSLLQAEICSLKKSAKDNQAWLNDLEQYGRRDCLEFRGIPVSVKEDTSDLICKVASLAGVEITAAEISTSHRIKPKTNLSKFPPPIIANFVSRDTRDEVYRARGKLRDFSTKDLNLGRLAVNPIFISESLSEMNKKLFKSALSCKKDLKYQFIWTLHGNIFLRKNTSSPAVQVKSDQVLVNLRQPASGHQQ